MSQGGGIDIFFYQRLAITIFIRAESLT